MEYQTKDLFRCLAFGCSTKMSEIHCYEILIKYLTSNYSKRLMGAPCKYTVLLTVVHLGFF